MVEAAKILLPIVWFDVGDNLIPGLGEVEVIVSRCGFRYAGNAFGDKGVGGGLTEFVYGTAGADAAQSAAMQQRREAEALYSETAGIINPATVQGLASLAIEHPMAV